MTHAHLADATVKYSTLIPSSCMLWPVYHSVHHIITGRRATWFHLAACSLFISPHTSPDTEEAESHHSVGILEDRREIRCTQLDPN